MEGQEHECDPDFIYSIGDGEDAYQRLVEAFRINCVAGFAGIILINPLHANFLPFVVLLQGTCNTVTHRMVLDQSNLIKQLYSRHMLPVLRLLVDLASDGDSRRRKLHLLNSKSLEGERYKIDHENFSFSGKIVEKRDRTYVEDLSDQDFIHNGKKLVNHLKHSS